MVTLLDIARAQKKSVVDNFPFWWGCIHTGQDRPCRISETGHENNATLFKKNLWKIKGYHENVGFQQTKKYIFDIVSSEGSGCHGSFREGRLGLNPLGQLRNPATKWGDEMGDQVDMTFFVEMPIRNRLGCTELAWVGLIILVWYVLNVFSWFFPGSAMLGQNIMLNCLNDTWD